LYQGEVLLAARLNGEDAIEYDKHTFQKIEFTTDLTLIDRPWKLFANNANELERDYELLTAGRQSAPLSSTNTLIGNRIFLEKGAVAEAAVFNTTTGPIYLAADSEVMEGSLVRGGLALGEHSALKLGTKIYGAVTIGPHCKVGGEVNNSVIFGYSNKGHDGFLGNSVLGEWCNIGADSNNSNLKNNYDEVRLWSYVSGGFERTGLQFCGLMMGDHSKCGINTMFNTGTVIGVSTNIFGSGFPRNFVPSFAWGGAQGFTEYKLNKALDTARRVMARRGIDLNEIEEAILAEVYKQSKQHRNF
jgi:UDP-N-acetylglucosamine diphosphorylase/glucosamine-1-phosphate N-acetyltransferase